MANALYDLLGLGRIRPPRAEDRVEIRETPLFESDDRGLDPTRGMEREPEIASVKLLEGNGVFAIAGAKSLDELPETARIGAWPPGPRRLCLRYQLLRRHVDEPKLPCEPMGECLDDNQALALLDGKLPPARREVVERHLESCANCRELLVALAQDDKDPERAVDTERAPATHSFGRTGHYKIENEVGQGAAGTVFRAIDDRNGEVVALKYVTDPAWRSRFRREVETLARLNHPGIVRYIDHGETRHGLYLAMEWLEGEDLAKCIRRGAIPWPDVRALGLRLVAALAHAHAQGAVHRDIGPRNIFLPGGRLEHAKLLDFGLVRIPDAVDQTTSKAVIGTPQYMAPEQIKDPRNVDARSDLFSLGIVFYEALSGRRPFDGGDLYSVWNNIVQQPAPNLRPLAPTAPASFIALVERMLAKDPTQRPQTAQAVHEALVRLDAPVAELGKGTAPMAPQSIGRGTAPLPQSMGKSTTPMTPRSVAWQQPALSPINSIPPPAAVAVARKKAPLMSVATQRIIVAIIVGFALAAAMIVSVSHCH
jgi:serine/threonine protein kinase